MPSPILTPTANANVLVNRHTPVSSESLTPNPVPCDFDGLLKLALNDPSILHILAAEKGIRQAVIAPVVCNSAAADFIEVRRGCLFNLLIERANGQLLAMCILDDTEHRLDFCHLVQQIESVLPQVGIGQPDYATLEVSISNAVGCTVTIEDVLLDTKGPGFYSNAVAGLGKSILAQVMAQCPANTPIPDIDGAQARTVDALKQQLLCARKQFLSGLDSSICSAITRSGADLTSKRYNAYRGLGKTARLRRLQAAQAFPLIGALQVEPDKQYAYIRRAVDRQLQLIPALAKGLGVPQEVVRWLVGKDIACVGQCWSGRLGELAKNLGLVCPEHRPVTSQEWTAFSDFLSSIEQLEVRIGCSPFLQNVDITTTLVQQIGKIGWSQATVRLAAIGATVSDLPDMSDLIAEAVQLLAEQIGESGVLSEFLHDELVPHLKKLYFSVGITRQLQASLRWHGLMLEPEKALVEQNRVVPASLHSWSAPFDGPLEIGGIVAICLTNPQQLKDEGDQMQHCVRSYADYCLYYGSTIISLREIDGTRLSTVELSLTENSSKTLRFTLRQHRGHKNIEAPAQAALAIKELLSTVNARSSEHQRQHIYKEQNERKAFRRTRSCNSIEPRRLEMLKQALKLHVGYDRFYEEAMQVAGRL